MHVELSIQTELIWEIIDVGITQQSCYQMQIIHFLMLEFTTSEKGQSYNKDLKVTFMLLHSYAFYCASISHVNSHLHATVVRGALSHKHTQRVQNTHSTKHKRAKEQSYPCKKVERCIA